MNFMAVKTIDAIVAGEGAGPHRKHVLRERFFGAILLSDGLAIVIGFALSGLIRFGVPFTAEVMIVTSVILPIFLLLSAHGLSAATLSDWRRGLGAPFMALLGAMAIVLFVGFYLKASTDLSRLMMLGGFANSVLLIALGRVAIGRVARRVFGDSVTSRLFIIDGVVLPAPVGAHRLDSDVAQLDGDLSDPFALDRLACCLDGFDSVTVACAPERREAWALALRATNIRAELLLPELAHVSELSHHGSSEPGLTILVSPGPLRSRDAVLKRLLDLTLASAAILFLAPLMLFTALAIKLDSRGPVLFVQRRVGHANRLFSVYKFRSMSDAGSDRAGAVSASRGDPRITRVGAFIRKTSIDELPQLLNILRGEMSFVGPRPHALGSLAGDELFWHVDPRYWQRHRSKPGLTGLAQVRGYRGATPHRDDLVNRLQADLEYLHGWNVFRDLAIMIGTLRVLVHKNAY